MSVLGKTTLEGWLTRSATMAFGSSKKWYFVLKGSGLLWYADRPKDYAQVEKPKGMVEVVPSSNVRLGAGSKANAIEIETQGSMIQLYADSKHEVDQWYLALKNALEDVRSTVRDIKDGRREGFLLKSSNDKGKTWRKRYFVVMPGRLVFFDQAPTVWVLAPKGVFDITAETIVSERMDNTGKQFVLSLQNEHGRWLLAAGSAENRKMWAEILHINVMKANKIREEPERKVGSWLRKHGLSQHMHMIIKKAKLNSFQVIRNTTEETIDALDLPQGDLAKLQLIVRSIQDLPVDEFVAYYGPLHKGGSAYGSIKPLGNLYQNSLVLEPAPEAELRETLAANRSSFIQLESAAHASLERRLYSWGDDSAMQLGVSAITQTGSICVPTFVQALKNKTEPFRVHAGYSAMACVTAKEGTVFSWGTGPLGQGDERESCSRPYIVPALNAIPIFEIGVGRDHMVAVAEDGRAFSWGEGFSGQLGLGENFKRTQTPIEIIGARGAVVSVSCGPQHTALLTEDGVVYTMGDGRHGRLGLGDQENQFKPTQVRNLGGHTIARIATGENFTVALSSDSTSCFWMGELAGDDGPSVPVRLQGFEDQTIATIAAAGEAAFFVTDVDLDNEDLDEKDLFTTSSVYSIGTNPLLLGHGKKRSCKSPTLIKALTGKGIVAISCSPTHAAALAYDGRLYTWGEDEKGQLGQGYYTPSPKPREAIGVAGYRYTWVTCGVNTTSAVLEFNPEFEKSSTPTPIGEVLPLPPPPKEYESVVERDEENMEKMLESIALMTSALERKEKEEQRKSSKRHSKRESSRAPRSARESTSRRSTRRSTSRNSSRRSTRREREAGSR